jgi:xanthine dehydrogenase YagS FAD-binding subunit
MILEGDTIKNIRLVCGAVECVPRRLTGSENIAMGRKKAEDTAIEAGKAASQGATPLQYNQYKVPLMENLVRRAIRDA